LNKKGKKSVKKEDKEKEKNYHFIKKKTKLSFYIFYGGA